MDYLTKLLTGAKNSLSSLSKLGEKTTNDCLVAVAEELNKNADYIIEQNDIDVANAKQKGVSDALVDRLRLTKARIDGMSEGLIQVASLNSPLGETVYSHQKENGLKIMQKRVPFGVIGIIFESRPNVTADAFALCFKTHNAVVLRGGSDAINSNKAIVKVIKKALDSRGVDQNAICLIEDTSRETVTSLMKAKGLVDLLIPRGGAGLIKSVTENATIPVIETGTGNCHIYIDEFASLEKAVDIIVNAKTQRYGVCNACESLVIHQKVLDKFLPKIVNALIEKGVEVRADERCLQVMPNLVKATEEDFYTEYLGPIISIKTVDSVEQAVAHINEHNTYHSESIITENASNAEIFMNGVDCSSVYHNASTRFTDGFEFGLGAEIGISTQKLHARGPMGLTALTTTKYYCYGDGQIRK